MIYHYTLNDSLSLSLRGAAQALTRTPLQTHAKLLSRSLPPAPRRRLCGTRALEGEAGKARLVAVWVLSESPNGLQAAASLVPRYDSESAVRLGTIRSNAVRIWAVPYDSERNGMTRSNAVRLGAVAPWPRSIGPAVRLGAGSGTPCARLRHAIPSRWYRPRPSFRLCDYLSQ
jgi:hypothetical protein